MRGKRAPQSLSYPIRLPDGVQADALRLLEQGMILPKTEKKRAGKNRKTIKAALASLREEYSDGGSTVELQSLIEQACNFYLKNGCFPSSYEEMQCAVSVHMKYLSETGEVEST
jgi:hypothetical protein